MLVDERRIRAGSKMSRAIWFDERNKIFLSLADSDVSGKQKGLILFNLDEQKLDSKSSVDHLQKTNKMNPRGLEVAPVGSARFEAVRPDPSSSGGTTVINCVVQGPGRSMLLLPALVFASKTDDFIEAECKNAFKNYAAEKGTPNLDPLFLYTTKGSVEQNKMEEINLFFIIQLKLIFGDDVLDNYSTLYELDCPSVHDDVRWIKQAKNKGVDVLFKPHNFTSWSQECDNGRIQGQIHTVYYERRRKLGHSMSPSMLEVIICLVAALNSVSEKAVSSAFRECGMMTFEDSKLSFHALKQRLEEVQAPIIARGGDGMSDIVVVEKVLEERQDEICMSMLAELMSFTNELRDAHNRKDECARRSVLETSRLATADVEIARRQEKFDRREQKRHLEKIKKSEDLDKTVKTLINIDTVI